MPGHRTAVNEAHLVPGFQLYSVLGQGGVGRVYRARDSMGRDVALKVMPLEVDDTRKKRFAQEASIGMLLNHPGIIEVYDAGTYDDVGWISMEVLDGSELGASMRDPAFGVDDRVRVIARVAAALHYAHEQGVIHRDVKPSNVFLTSKGDVKLLDFGIARLKANKITKTGFIVGTPQYMAPEQVTGIGIDARADVFSLGIVAYELLTGKLPWSGENHTQIMMAICSKPARSFEAMFQKNVRTEMEPQQLRRLHNTIHRAIRQEPEHRYSTAAEFEDALHAYLEGNDPLEDITVTDVDPDAAGKQRFDWAMARAARAKVEEEAPVSPLTEPVTRYDEESPSAGNRLWMLLIALFAVGLGFAVWYMKSLGE